MFASKIATTQDCRALQLCASYWEIFLTVVQLEKSLLFRFCNFTMLQKQGKIFHLIQWFSTFSEPRPILCFLKVCIVHCPVDHRCWTIARWPPASKKKVSTFESALFAQWLPWSPKKRSSPLGERFLPWSSKKKGQRIGVPDFCQFSNRYN